MITLTLRALASSLVACAFISAPLSAQALWLTDLDSAEIAGLGPLRELSSFVNPAGRMIELPQHRCAGAKPDSIALVSGGPDRLVSDAHAGVWVLRRDAEGNARGRQVAPPARADTLRVEVVEAVCHNRLLQPISLLLKRGATHLVYFSPNDTYPTLRLIRGPRVEPAVWSSLYSRFLTAAEERDDDLQRRRSILAERRRQGWTPAISRAVDRGEVLVGMTPSMVRAAWGRPESVNRTTTAAGISEQWVYGVGRYVYLRAGRVYAVQERN